MTVARPPAPASRIQFDMDVGDRAKPVAWLRMRAEGNRVAATTIEAEIATVKEKIAKLEAEAAAYRAIGLTFDEAAELLMANGYDDADPEQPSLFGATAPTSPAPAPGGENFHR